MPRTRLASCFLSDTPNISPITMPMARITRRRRGAVGMGREAVTAGRPGGEGASLALSEVRNSKRAANSSADGSVAPDNSEHISSISASMRCSASWARPSDASRRPQRDHGATHDPRCPDVAENTTLVADLVGEPGLLQELVELVPVRLGHLGADVGNLVLEVRRSRARGPRARHALLGATRRGTRARTARKFETVDQAVPHKTEVRRHRRAGPHPARPAGPPALGQVRRPIRAAVAPRHPGLGRSSAVQARQRRPPKQEPLPATGPPAQPAPSPSSPRHGRESPRSARKGPR